MIPQRWLVLSARAPSAEQHDLLPSALVELGGRAVREGGEGWLTTHLPPEAQVPPRQVPHGTVAGGPDPSPAGGEAIAGSDGWMDALRRWLREGWGIDGVETRCEWQEHGDWAELWKQGWEARHLSPRLMVVPTWIEVPAPSDPEVRVVQVDPGMAFGTAEHPTTRGCLRLLDGLIQGGENVLDVGAGSAILSVAAVLLGARGAVAVEGDPLACPAARENVELNRVAAQVEVVEEWVTPQGLLRWAPREVVVANIETGILLPLLPGLRGTLADGGALILSGILQEEASLVKEAANAVGLDWEREDAEGLWWTGLFRRRG